MPWGLTPLHLIVILIVVLIVVGPGRLPETGAAIGKAVRGFREAIEGKDENAGGNAAHPADPAAPQAFAQPGPVYPQAPYQPYPPQPGYPQPPYPPAQYPQGPYPAQGQAYPPAPPVYPAPAQPPAEQPAATGQTSGTDSQQS